MYNMAFGKLLLFIFCAFVIVNGQKKVIELDEDNWTDMLKDEWMVEFYAPWCPACKSLQSTWKDFATWSKALGIKVAQVDVTKSPGLSGRFMVTALPTIFHVLNGEFRQYKGSRDKDSFASFIEERKWREVEKVSPWMSPTSIQMSVISSFFKLSQTLRQIHYQLTEDFGLPTWGSYLIFALVTIILGALLGLILVCSIDLLFPQKQVSAKKVENNRGSNKKTDDNGANELPDEDIKDDLVDDASQSEGDKSEREEVEKDINKSPNSVKKRKSRKAD